MNNIAGVNTNRTDVVAFAELCLTSRPQRQLEIDYKNIIVKLIYRFTETTFLPFSYILITTYFKLIMIERLMVIMFLAQYQNASF